MRMLTRNPNKSISFVHKFYGTGAIVKEFQIHGSILTIFYDSRDYVWISQIPRISQLKQLANFKTINDANKLHQQINLHGGRSVFGDEHSHMDFCKMITPEILQAFMFWLVKFQYNSTEKQSFIGGAQQGMVLAKKLMDPTFLIKNRHRLSFIYAIVEYTKGMENLGSEQIFVNELEVVQFTADFERFYQKNHPALMENYNTQLAIKKKIACSESFFCCNTNFFSVLVDNAKNGFAQGAMEQALIKAGSSVELARLAVSGIYIAIIAGSSYIHDENFLLQAGSVAAVSGLDYLVQMKMPALVGLKPLLSFATSLIQGQGSLLAKTTTWVASTAVSSLSYFAGKKIVDASYEHLSQSMLSDNKYTPHGH